MMKTRLDSLVRAARFAVACPFTARAERARVGLARAVTALWAVALLGACSGQDATRIEVEQPLLGEERPAGAVGNVTLAVTSGGIDLSSLAFTLRDAGGRVIAEESLDVSESAATVAVALDVPPGEGYALTLVAESATEIRCTGTAEFDVVAGSTVEVPIELACEASGGVRVVGTLTPASACPSVELAPLSAPVPVGERVSLSAAPSSAGEASYAWASSGGQLDGSLTASAGFTCTEAGPVTLTLTATQGTCSDTASVVVECAAASGGACAGLGSNCHVVDPGSGPLHECHELGHGGDEAACSAGRAACMDSCGAELCTVLGSLCHEVDPGSGPLHDCHELGHAGVASACFERGRECFDLCTEARAAAAQPVTLQFRAVVGDEGFACGTVYEDIGTTGVSAEPLDFRFFVSNVRLVDAEGRQEPVALDTRAPWQAAGVGLLDFEDASGACGSGTAAVNTTLTGRVFPGEYTGIAFSVSVPESQNHLDPATQPAPLELGSMSWGWLLGYRFLRAEMAPVGDGAPATGIGLLHLGSTACTGNPQAGTVVCSRPNRNEVQLTGFDAAASTIVADIAALFENTDLQAESLCHSTGELCAGPFVSAGVNLATGAALPEQTLFRVE